MLPIPMEYWDQKVAYMTSLLLTIILRVALWSISFLDTATGEPPTCMSVGVVFAIRNALRAGRLDAGASDDWFEISKF